MLTIVGYSSLVALNIEPCLEDVFSCTPDISLAFYRLFGPTKECFACLETILASEYVIDVAKTVVFHLKCFQCYECQKSFCIGDQFVFDKAAGRVLCTNEDCYISSPEVSLKQ